MKLTARLLLILAGAASWTGCKSVHPTPDLPRLGRGTSVMQVGPTSTNIVDLQGRWHSIRVSPRPDQPPIYTLNKFSPVWWFENIDDPNPPPWYRPNRKFRKFFWYCRNPFHNF